MIGVRFSGVPHVQLATLGSYQRIVKVVFAFIAQFGQSNALVKRRSGVRIPLEARIYYLKLAGENAALSGVGGNGSPPLGSLAQRQSTWPTPKVSGFRNPQESPARE